MTVSTEGSALPPSQSSESRVLLVKHAAPEMLPDVPSSRWTLSDLGRRQSVQLPARVAGYAPDALFSSVEPKARETAEILGTHLGLSPSIRPGLQENDRTGLPFFRDPTRFEQRIEAFFRRSAEKIVGNESADEAHERFSSSVRDLPRSAGAGTTVVVSHGAVISLLVARANGLDPCDLWRELKFTSFVVLRAPSLVLHAIDHPSTHPRTGGSSRYPHRVPGPRR